jgi:protein-tyrosine phosphatase
VMSDWFAVLFVCHANQIRSAMAERLLCHTLTRRFGAEAADVLVASGGTHADPGIPMQPHAAQVLKERGISPGRFASRPLTRELVGGANLILTADRGQRSECVSLVPAATRHTFTLRQFGRLVAATDQDNRPGTALPARLHELLDALAGVRARLQPVEPCDDELADPNGRPVEAFRVCADQIQAVLNVVVAAVTRS